MLSICIPIYNFDVTTLIQELSEQVKLLDVPCEIILIDDCSENKFKSINDDICTKETYIKLDKNIGRAKIRNLFLSHAKYDYLLFLDCDAIIISKDFISKYIETIRQINHNIICGGRIYNAQHPDKSKMLRWKYGIKKESQPYHIRILSPNKSFMTNNFLAHRKIFEIVKFDERIAGYGHEDTLFGYLLKKNNIPVLHIDNPVLNGDLEENSEYLEKTEKGILNLIHIVSYVNYDKDFINDVTLLSFYHKIDSKHLTFLTKFFYICFKPFIKWLLRNGFICLWLFDFYKLGFLTKNYQPSQEN